MVIRRRKFLAMLFLTAILGGLLIMMGQHARSEASGQKVSEAFLKANPPHDHILEYVPTVQLVSYCLNAPALVLTNLIDRIPACRSFWEQGWLGG
jgi:hypothetical protein